ncbi:Hypothetical protein POVN_LOCUS482 [uncultured virus]|nr:Hypothetical protein POVN_LOCUS482 [uncultured virus]
MDLIRTPIHFVYRLWFDVKSWWGVFFTRAEAHLEEMAVMFDVELGPTELNDDDAAILITPKT